MRRGVISALMLLALPLPAAASDVALGYIPSITAVSAYVARDRGFFADGGLNVTMRPIDQGSTAVAAIVSNSLQITTSLPTNFIQAYAAGLDIVVIANSHVYPTDNLVGVIARAGSGISSLHDLPGKRVAVNGLQGIQHLLMLQAMRQQGVDSRNVTMVEVAFPQMGDALRAAQVDAATLSEPYYQRIVDAHVGAVIQDLQSDIPAGTMGTVYIATRDWVAGHPAAVAAFRSALRHAVSAIKDDPVLARQSVVRALGMDPSVAALLHIPNLATDATADQLDFWVKLMRDEGALTSPVEITRMVAP